MSATKTANGKYDYKQIVRGKPLDDWVQATHKVNCEKNNWDYRALKRGAFGYDSIAVSIMRLIEFLKEREIELASQFPDSKNAKCIDLEKMSSLVHDGWAENYIYWRDNKPYETGGMYFKPFNDVGDKRRDKCAAKEFISLPEAEKAKDRMIASYVSWCWFNRSAYET
ncbi:hypothetical protein OAG24_01215 [bacterium]|nr:hypothetical protein [bacterium]